MSRINSNSFTTLGFPNMRLSIVRRFI